ncbi:tetratricopeptide repeat protein [Isosphaeraceae bacterium EP7]
MPGPQAGSLLVDCYEAFLRNHDIEAFRENVSARYNEGTLCRMVQNGEVNARRAAVLALGLTGSFESNGAVAKGMCDPDPTVRNLADNALWAIWFRADSPENNEALEAVRSMNNRQRFATSIELADKLIERAPKFAEAYNQRAIARFLLGQIEESAADCRTVLKLNPYHFGALQGMGQCYLRLGQRDKALATFRQALKIQPYSQGLKETVATLESEE